jgi:peptide/nickel transport system substrate-binding protein
VPRLCANLLFLATLAHAMLSAPAFAKDDLVIGAAQFPSSLHPFIDAEGIKYYVLGFVLRPVSAVDKDGQLVCMLCAEVPTIANGLARIEDRPNGGKGMAVTIRLRSDIKWSDGAPVTAKDLEFTWRVARDPSSGFSNIFRWDRATGVEVIDDHTAILRLDTVQVLYNLWDAIIPEHIEGPAYAKAASAGGYINNTVYNRAPTTAGLYDGPYMITGYESGNQIVLEPNPHWPGTAPGFKRIAIRLIGNTTALQANMLSGDVDMMAGESLGLTIDQVVALQKQYPDRFTYLFKPAPIYERIDLQKNNPILSDIRVRRALLIALDRKTLVEKLFGGLQPVANTWLPTLDPNYSAEVPIYDYDVAKARAMLAEAGWTPGSDGICRNVAGERLSLQLTSTAGNRLRELIELVLQSQWKAACIEVTIKNEPLRTLLGDTIKHRTYPAMVMFASITILGRPPRSALATDMIPSAENNYGGTNWSAFSDPRMDAAITAAESELDPDKQMPIWADMQRVYAEQLPQLPLYFRAELHVVPKWLTGYVITGHGRGDTSFWAENWRGQ